MTDFLDPIHFMPVQKNRNNCHVDQAGTGFSSLGIVKMFPSDGCSLKFLPLVEVHIPP